MILVKVWTVFVLKTPGLPPGRQAKTPGPPPGRRAVSLAAISANSIFRLLNYVHLYNMF